MALSEQERHILSLLDDSDPESVRVGAQLAGSTGLAAAVPALIRHITSSNTGVQESVDRALRKIGGPEVVHAVIPMLRSDDAPVRNLAMDLLRALGHTDLPAMQRLLQDDDADIRIFASDILGSTNSVLAVSTLCDALLNDPEVNVRYQAAVSLGQLGFPEAAPCLNQALDDEEWVQFSVIEALTKVKDASSVGALATALNNASELVSSIIVDALGEMGDVKAVPLLLKRLSASPKPLGNKIVRAVLNIMGERSLNLLGAKENERLRGYLPSALADEDVDVQNAAIKGFAALGGSGASGHVLRHAARLDPEKDVDRLLLAVEALAALGHTPELDQALREGNDFTAQIAAEVLIRVDEPAAVALMKEVFWERSRDMQRMFIVELADRAAADEQDFFLDVLARHEDGNVLRGALLFLGSKGDPAVVLDKLLPFLEHPYNDVKESALEACIILHTPEVEQYLKTMAGSIDPIHRMIGIYGLGFFDVESTASYLSEALEDESADVRKVAVEAFGRCCAGQDEYLELVERKLADDNREVRMAVFDTLGLCPNERFFNSLMVGLDDSDPWVRVRCAERLGDNKVTQAVPALVGMLTDDNTLIVIKAVTALGKIGGEAAFKALLPLLDHQDRDVLEAAEEAVNAIHRQAGE